MNKHAGDDLIEAVARRTADFVLAELPKAEPVEPQQWFTVAQAAIYCGVSQDAIRSAIKTGALRKHTRGERSVALSRADLDAWASGRS